MRIPVRVRPNSAREDVSRAEDGTWTVRVSAPPADGRANERVVALLAARFRVAKSRVTILRGRSSRLKLVEIDVPDPPGSS